MKLLILGGTKFLGRAAAEAALERGHELTLFNRGETNAELFPGAEKLRGDRGGDLSALEGRSWDAVIDPSGFVPGVVRRSTEVLHDSGFYLFVSSISVYASHAGPVDEDSALAELGELTADELLPDYSNYGALKALCERAVTDVFPGRSAAVRAGLIAGPHDPTGRFTYWPHRVSRGGEVLAPAPPERIVQFVDVRDLGEWLVDLCERKEEGTFNATRPGVAWGELLETCRDMTGSDARLVWVSDEFLGANGVAEWTDLPLWICDPEWLGTHQADVSRALAAGLRFRPLADTIRGALEQALPTDEAGLTPKREAELLDAWRARV